MQTFYVTYANGSNLSHSYSVIRASNYVAARDHVFAKIGPKFAFMYDEGAFFGMAVKYGLTPVVLQPQIMDEGE